MIRQGGINWDKSKTAGFQVHMAQILQTWFKAIQWLSRTAMRSNGPTWWAEYECFVCKYAKHMKLADTFWNAICRVTTCLHKHSPNFVYGNNLCKFDDFNLKRELKEKSWNDSIFSVLNSLGTNCFQRRPYMGKFGRSGLVSSGIKESVIIATRRREIFW